MGHRVRRDERSGETCETRIFNRQLAAGRGQRTAEA
jgi:hypothetical protein